MRGDNGSNSQGGNSRASGKNNCCSDILSDFASFTSCGDIGGSNRAISGGIRPIVCAVFQDMVFEQAMSFEAPMIIHSKGALIIGELWEMRKGGSSRSSVVV